ncbi:MAG: acyl-ACP--UDP-N-acetylglucosamine O-acyltransferase [Verrucomicrobia bacterium]|nr:acyl-ACP--UDP-N-acetylglucosamine O-acyltransferase [Verrucomicrobiota bacterium]
MSARSEVQIHPTAIIEDGAILGPGVFIGPYAIVGPHATIGAGCRIEAHAQVVNEVHLGEDCLVGRGAILGDHPQSISFDPATPSSLRIGARNQFREHVTVHRGAKEGSATIIGSDNYFMVGSHVGHDAVIGDRNIIANACLLGGHVVVGNRAFLGGGAGFHQFTRVGDLAMVQGNAIVNRDVPPYVIAGAQSQLFGLNTIGLRRAGIPPEHRDDLKRAFHLVFRGDLNLSQALAQAASREWSEEAGRLLEFLRASSHQGICRVRVRSGE